MMDTFYLRREPIDELMARRYWGQRKLAYRLNLSPGHFSQLLNRKRTAGKLVRQRLMDGLNLSFETLFEVIPRSTRPTPAGAELGDPGAMAGSSDDNGPDTGQAGQGPLGDGITGSAGHEQEE
jgi:transcriptional regulator with XRE-family HTH domain